MALLGQSGNRPNHARQFAQKSNHLIDMQQLIVTANRPINRPQLGCGPRRIDTRRNTSDTVTALNHASGEDVEPGTAVRSVDCLRSFRTRLRPFLKGGKIVLQPFFMIADLTVEQLAFVQLTIDQYLPLSEIALHGR